MKKFIIILICIVCFCGCSNIDSMSEIYYEPQDQDTVIDIKNTEKIKLYNLLNQKLWYDLSDMENKETEYFKGRNDEDADKILSIDIDDILDNMDKIDDMEIIQQNGRDVSIYKDKEYKNVIVTYDKQNISSVNGEASKPKKYLDTIENICNKSELIFFDYRLGSKRNVISFMNNEFLIFSQNNHSVIFDQSYSDVKVKFKNIPLDFIVFFDDNKIDKVHIAYIDVKYDTINISDKNKQQIKEVFEQNGVDNADEILQIFEACLKNKDSESGESDNFSWKNIKKLKYNNRYEYNDFIIEIK